MADGGRLAGGIALRPDREDRQLLVVGRAHHQLQRRPLLRGEYLGVGNGPVRRQTRQADMRLTLDFLGIEARRFDL